MEQLTKFQVSLTQLLGAMRLDEAAILFIILALEDEAAQGAMALYIRDNPNATQEKLMEEAVEMQKLAERMRAEGLLDENGEQMEMETDK